MIVCHCRAITDRDIHAAIDWMRASDPHTIITPGKVFRALGTTSDCGGCLSLFLDTMRGNPNLEVPLELCSLKVTARKKETET
ncbi:(2Fe-2S)-binding protein [Rhodovulum euryhalinum]|uniref:BFD-like [2Fe-2S] binding protein n=1 Tax=Rhodovulum euryhalinum TaxID=35805 RepID=A0A4R2KL72_9RHOB|nr:(2Fe-2S)-binding protein [Rhodovulum euryhalinum]TCO73332.1 BFD-like [2Fe-2S] binding protein [Rhodovulum euryhalinum]